MLRTIDFLSLSCYLLFISDAETFGGKRGFLFGFFKRVKPPTCVQI